MSLARQLTAAFDLYRPSCVCENSEGRLMSGRYARILDVDDLCIRQHPEYFCSSCGATVLLSEVKQHQVQLRPSEQKQDSRSNGI